MSRTLASVVSADVPAFRGTFSFDGETFESFGFGEVRSVRIPVELIEDVELRLDKGLLKTQALRIHAAGGCLGLDQPFEASDAEVPALADLAERIRRAIAGGGAA